MKTELAIGKEIPAATGSSNLSAAALWNHADIVALKPTAQAPTLPPLELYQAEATIKPDATIAQHYQDARQFGLNTDIVRVAHPPELDHPMRGREELIIGKIAEQAWQGAYKLFPELAAHGLDEKAVERLSKAIVANELYFYDRKDQADDIAVSLTGKPVPVPGMKDQDRTLGIAQLAPAAVEKDRKEFPQLASYLNDRGLGKASDTEIVENPAIVPMLVAANLAHNAEMYARHNLPVNEQTLAYGYNPDVYFRHDDSGKTKPLSRTEAFMQKLQGHRIDTAWPTGDVLAKSEHVTNVQRWWARFE